MKNKNSYQAALLVILSAVSLALISWNLYLSQRDHVNIEVLAAPPHEQN